MRLLDPERLEGARRALLGDDVRLHLRAAELRRVALGEAGIVDVGDDRPAEVGDLLVVGREEAVVALRPEPDEPRLEPRPERTEQQPVLQAAESAPVGDHREVGVDAVQARQELGVARVVVTAKPVAEEEDPVGGRSRCREPAKAPSAHAHDGQP